MNFNFKLPVVLVSFLLVLVPVVLQSQNALNFDGTNDYVQTTYAGIPGSANRTFEAWVNVNPNATANVAILDYGLNAVGSRNTFLVNPNNQLVFISGGTNANISSSTNAVPSSQWVHVAFVLNNGTGFLYVNGNQVGTGSLTTVNTPSGNANLRIGQRVAGGNIPFLGAIDEVRVWDVARTSTEILADMNTEFCVIPSSLKAYYKFNQGTANGSNTGVTTLNDNSGNANPGVLNGFALSGTSSNWVPGASLSSTSASGGTNTVSGCVPFLSPGNQVLNTTGVYQDTVVMVSGCDSIYTLDFTALNQSNSTISPSACISYVSPGGNVITTSGTYSDTLVNSAGCDSIITINLTILTNTQANQVGFACDSFISPSGKIWTTPGTYQDTILNMAGCDSIMTINVVIYSSENTSITNSSCGPYVSNLGNTYNTSGTYTETTQTVNGCDSIITLNLTITSTDTSVNQNGNTLTSNQNGASYQWINCDNQMPISGANTQSFTPGMSGNYSVQIQNGICFDTSSCYSVTLVNIPELEKNSITLYPNPTTGKVTIDPGRVYNNVWVRVMDARGKIVKSVAVESVRHIQLGLGQNTGLYTVQVYTEDGYRTFRVIKVD